ncbi:MAG TPA: ATP-binding protein, partial [Sandaracinaceae bacterium LLY-WYZ-13_1]|nr:ATP-binding protein [Sandaracinaceae bacterium LLY-WYZ-13_1]
TLPWPACWVDGDGRLVEGNDAAVRRFGAGSPRWLASVAPSDRATAEKAWDDARKDGTPLRLELSLRPAGAEHERRYRLEAHPGPGARRWLLMLSPRGDPSVPRATDADGDPMRHAIDAAGGMVYVANLETDALESCYGLERLLGHPPEEVRRRRDWIGLVHPEDLTRCLPEVERATREDDALEIEYRIRHRDGGWVVVHENARVLRDEEGWPTRHVGVVMDVTDRAEAERTLRIASRHKNQLLAMLGHELRNPLAALATAVESLAEAPAHGASLVPLMRRQVHNLGRLVDDLADTARVVRGEITLRREPVKLDEILAHALRTARPTLEAHEHEPDVSWNGPLETYGDPMRLEQLVVNLLTNAAKYTEPEDRIEVTLHRDGATGVLEVRDEGRGIDPDLLPSIFDLFTQGERAEDRPEGGLGVGLSLSRQLAELHGGTLRARSEGLGRGSTFTLRLPLRRSERRPIHTPAALPATGAERPLRVLVVDDNEDAAEMLAQVLSRSGHRVRTAFDGEEVLEAAREFVPEVAVLDIGLPRRNGYELAMAMRGDPNLRDARLIALTGYGTRDDRRRARRAGFDHHLVKPARAGELRALIQPRDA